MRNVERKKGSFTQTSPRKKKDDSDFFGEFQPASQVQTSFSENPDAI